VKTISAEVALLEIHVKMISNVPRTITVGKYYLKVSIGNFASLQRFSMRIALQTGNAKTNTCVQLIFLWDINSA
jgi:hypothetical protein